MVTFILVSAGTPQMQSHPIDSQTAPPEYIKQSLGWVSEKEGFGVRLFKRRKGSHQFRDSGRAVLVYDEEIPNPALCYMALDFKFFASEGVWKTPTERNLEAVLETPTKEAKS